jgi:hypothetical protein
MILQEYPSLKFDRNGLYVILWINSIPSSSPVSYSWAYWMALRRGWNYLSNGIHFLLFILNRGKGDLLEGRLHSLSILSAGSQVLDLRMLGEELLDRWVLHLALLLAVDLVSDQDEGELLRLLRRSLVQEFSDPGLNVVKWLNRPWSYSLVGDVVDQHAAISPSVEGSSQTPKFLLTGSVPDLSYRTSTSRLMTFPSTITSFSMKSAPTVAL